MWYSKVRKARKYSEGIKKLDHAFAREIFGD